MPEGFAHYARVFHPVIRRTTLGEQHLSWRAIARANGRVVHREMQYASIASSPSHRPGGPGWSEPPTGTLTRDLAATLVRVLAAHTTTSGRCWFAVWEGWGGLSLPDFPRFEHPGRAYYLAEGDVSAASHSVFDTGAIHYQSASMWWPDDRAWFVSTEIDLDSTYIGATVECIDALLAHPALEAMPAELGDAIDYAGDRVNPMPSPVEQSGW